MPKTPVDEDDLFQFSNNDIGFSRKRLTERGVTEVTGSHYRPNDQFRRGSFRTDSTHYLRSFGFTELVRQGMISDVGGYSCSVYNSISGAMHFR